MRGAGRAAFLSRLASRLPVPGQPGCARRRTRAVPHRALASFAGVRVRPRRGGALGPFCCVRLAPFLSTDHSAPAQWMQWMQSMQSMQGGPPAGATGDARRGRLAVEWTAGRPAGWLWGGRCPSIPGRNRLIGAVLGRVWRRVWRRRSARDAILQWHSSSTRALRPGPRAASRAGEQDGRSRQPLGKPG